MMTNFFNDFFFSGEPEDCVIYIQNTNKDAVKLWQVESLLACQNVVFADTHGVSSGSQIVSLHSGELFLWLIVNTKS